MNLHWNTSQRTWHHSIVSSFLLISLYPTIHWSWLRSEIAARDRSKFSMILLLTFRMKMVVRLCFSTWSWSFISTWSIQFKSWTKTTLSKMWWKKGMMIRLFVWSLWTLRWSLRQLNTVIIKLRTLERELYHGMELWFSILF